MCELLASVVLHQVNNAQRIPAHTRHCSYTAEVLHIPVQHSATRGLGQGRQAGNSHQVVRAGPGKVGADSKGQRADHEESHSWQGNLGWIIEMAGK